MRKIISVIAGVMAIGGIIGSSGNCRLNARNIYGEPVVSIKIRSNHAINIEDCKRTSLQSAIAMTNTPQAEELLRASGHDEETITRQLANNALEDSTYSAAWLELDDEAREMLRQERVLAEKYCNVDDNATVVCTPFDQIPDGEVSRKAYDLFGECIGFANARTKTDTLRSTHGFFRVIFPGPVRNAYDDVLIYTGK